MKKLFLIVLAFFAGVQAQGMQQEQDTLFQGLVFDIGMNLSEQNLIIDKITIKNALLHLYEDITQVAQITDLLLLMDEELIENNITTIDELIDFELDDDDDVVQAAIAWLAAYQNLFILFKLLHPDEATFLVWSEDMEFFASLEDGEEPFDSDYLEMWHASCVLLEAQNAFEDALNR